MNRIFITVVLFLSCSFLFGCGRQTEGGDTDKGNRLHQEDSEGSTDSDGSPGSGGQAGMGGTSGSLEEAGYFDIFVEQEHIFQWKEKDGKAVPKEGSWFMGMQFYQDEPVQLWLIPDKIPWLADLCLCRTDGSQEVLLAGISVEHSYHMYLDQEGNIYCWYNPTIDRNEGKADLLKEGLLVKYLPSGETAFERKLDTKLEIHNMCQAGDGRLYVTMRGEADMWLAEMNPDTGQETKLCGGQPVAKARDDLTLGCYGDMPATWYRNRIEEIHAADRAETEMAEPYALLLGESTYVSPTDHITKRIKQDFRILENGSVEVLWATSNGRAGLLEKLKKSEIEKIPVIVRSRTPTTWLTKRISLFNQSNKDYHVVLEDRAEDMEDFARLTSVQIASGKGPDILMGNLMEDYIPGMIEKGALEDLRPYMEKSGIREEDYFPYVFAPWREGDSIYGINPAQPGLYGYVMDGSVLGGIQEPEIGTLVDALLARQEDAVFLEGYNAWDLMELFLKGSDTLWGMVDWDEEKCDFSNDLFIKILETAKRYGDDGNSDEKPSVASHWSLWDIFHFESLSDRMESGKVVCGVIFDDGCHAAVKSLTTLAVNANSANKEGAWEFISYLLSDEVQTSTSDIGLASKSAFDAWVEGQKDQVADGREIHEMVTDGTRLPDGSSNIVEHRTYSEADLTQERIDEYLETLKGARTCPFRTLPLFEIIKEETAYFFLGNKSAEEVCPVITNRVQLYLDEGQ